MCGLLFVSNSAQFTHSELHNALKKQSWRGPDASRDEYNTHYAGHCRLSIIDPGGQSDQPLNSTDGVFTIIFNGEIYNHNELRNDYKLSCKTNSDTEVILQGFIN